MKEEFIQFLKDDDAYDEFVREFEQLHCSNMTLDEYLNSTKYGNYICSAFTWCDTSLKDPYWNELNRKWQQYIYDRQRTSESDNTTA